MSGIRCWQCGVEPTGVADVRTLSQTEPSYIPTGWPDGDHEHDTAPPTPGALLAAGSRAYDRVMEAWTE